MGTFSLTVGILEVTLRSYTEQELMEVSNACVWIISSVDQRSIHYDLDQDPRGIHQVAEETPQF